MNVNDPIADLLTRIRNAQKVGIEVLTVPASRAKISITHILREEGFVKNYKCIRDNKQGLLKIALKYDALGKGVIRGIDRVSTPSKRVYVGHENLPKVRSGFGLAIISTSSGIVSDKAARDKKIGGELLCTVY